MNTTPKSNTPTADLVAALAELDNIKPNKINPAYKAKYITLDLLLDSVKPILFSHNLALIQTLVSEENKIGVATAFLHATGERFDFGRLMIKSDVIDAQKIGGAITYIRRMSICTACGVSVDNDSDGNDLVAAHSFRSAAVQPALSHTSAPVTFNPPTPRPLTK